MKKEKFQRWLPVELSDAKILERSREMGQLLEQKRKIEREKAQIVKDFSDQIKDISGEIAKLTTIVNTGQEEQQVTCVREYDHNNKEVREVRIDTGEILTTRPLQVDESQIPLQTGKGVDASF